MCSRGRAQTPIFDGVTFASSRAISGGGWGR
jgi:hypothetical protein